ncbi:MAG: bifunctional 3,4-dihydroxy-2-butanone-4-phosphate synthase/GTP cyclohydrolase II [Planctomycetota bacterium]|nr:bifunctional 3,4-dihydroxy-2-butanone-4-phosphate synthase/GTP cyclohydrolase II [Planctomycetota bacterium]
MENVFCSVEEAIEEIRSGRMVVLVDDENRENEGDLAMAAEKVTPQAINFMARYGRGLICLALTEEKADSLDLPPMVKDNRSRFGTAFTVSVDAARGVTTGISAADRATTILSAVKPDAKPDDLVRPGHIFPLRARDGGVLVRAGQTEGIVDLARLAGLTPAGVICEIMNEDGTMARLPQLVEFSKRHNLRIISVAAIIRYRHKNEKLIEQVARAKLPTHMGEFELFLYKSIFDKEGRDLHVVLTMGGVGIPDSGGKVRVFEEPLLVRVHDECLTGDVFGSLRCDCGEQLRRSMEMIAKEKKGVILYMKQEGRGIGLANKLRAYELMEKEGCDTVEANERLGFPPDLREYGIGAQILFHLGVRRMRLLTNNPRKIVALSGYGLEVVERLSIEVPPNPLNKGYLKTKKEKLGHIIKDV